MSSSKSKDILKNIFSLSSDGIACTDPAGNILFSNDSFNSILGYSYNETSGMNIHKILISENGLGKFIPNNNEVKFYEKKFLSKSCKTITLQVKFWEQPHVLSEGTIWLVIKCPCQNENHNQSFPAHKNDTNVYLYDLKKHLNALENYLKNMQQDFGDSLNNTNDYISAASKSCKKAKDLLNKIFEGKESKISGCSILNDEAVKAQSFFQN